MKQVLGRKVGMTRIYDDTGIEIPVTVIEVEPHVVIGLRTQDKNGYDAVVVGVGEETRGRVPRQIAGQFPDGVDSKRSIHELRAEQDYEVGQTIDAAVFQPGDPVKITGRSRGRGFAGVVRRHGFKGGPNTHGSMNHRLPGSIGQSASPSRVFKGTRMGGRVEQHGQRPARSGSRCRAESARNQRQRSRLARRPAHDHLGRTGQVGP